MVVAHAEDYEAQLKADCERIVTAYKNRRAGLNGQSSGDSNQEKSGNLSAEEQQCSDVCSKHNLEYRYTAIHDTDNCKLICHCKGYSKTIQKNNCGNAGKAASPNGSKNPKTPVGRGNGNTNSGTPDDKKCPEDLLLIENCFGYYDCTEGEKKGIYIRHLSGLCSDVYSNVKDWGCKDTTYSNHLRLRGQISELLDKVELGVSLGDSCDISIDGNTYIMYDSARMEGAINKLKALKKDKESCEKIKTKKWDQGKCVTKQ